MKKLTSAQMDPPPGIVDNGTFSDMDMPTNTSLPPPTLAEIIDMLFDARRTIEAQDKLIKELQEELQELKK